MSTLRIGRFHSRYRLPAGELAARSRLDRVLRRVCNEALEPAVGQAGAADELVCLRRVHADVRLDLDAPDHVIVAAWGAALAAAIRAAVTPGGAEVVRYESRAAALLELVEAATAGDLRRCWAWRQLGLWGGAPRAGSQAVADEVVRALAAEPERIVPVLAAAARRGSLGGCAATFGAARWRLLADAALAAHGARALPSATIPWSGAEPERAPFSAPHPGTEATLAEGHGLPIGGPEASPHTAVQGQPAAPVPRSVGAEDTVGEGQHLQPAAPGRSRAAAIERASALWAALGQRLRNESERRSLAVLAVLEVDPASCRRGEPTLGAVLDALVRRSPGAGELPPQRPAEPGDTPQLLPRVRATTAAANPPRSLPMVRATTAPLQPSAERDAPLRRRARTAYGGLLFLLQVVEELNLPEEIRAGQLGADHSLRWVLHQVALALCPIAPDDPAALAFAGLGPDQVPPSLLEDAATDSERALLDDLGTRIAAALVERFGGELQPEQALDLVCRRNAEILADPGWIEVRLALEDLATDIRRAALDLDLGFVEWLGVVVRFRYV